MDTWFHACWCQAVSRSRTLGAMGQNLAQTGAFQLENWLVSAGESGIREEGAQGWRGEVEEGEGLAHRAEHHQGAQIPWPGGLVLLHKPSSDLRKSFVAFESLIML